MPSSGSATFTVTFLPRMSSTLTSFFVLSRSSWYSPRRPSSSRACSPWNSSTSSPSGVVISITRMFLGLMCLCRGRFRGLHFRRLHDEPRDRRAGFEPQFGAGDLGLEIVGGEDALDVVARVAVAAVWADGVAGPGIRG